MRYGSLLSSRKWLSAISKCRGNMVYPSTTLAKTVSKPTVLELRENKGYFNLVACHLVISWSWASCYSSSERGRSGLSADLKKFNIIQQIGIFQAYFWVVLGSAIELFFELSFLWQNASNLIIIVPQPLKEVQILYGMPNYFNYSQNN